VQPARHFVAVGIEFAARVQLGENNLRRRNAFFGVDVYRNTAAVINHGDRIVDVDGNFNLGAIPGQRLVDRVIDNLINEVMQTVFARRADIHGRAHTDSFQPFEDLN